MVGGGGASVDPTVEFFSIRRLRTVIRVTTVSANQKAVFLCRGVNFDTRQRDKECFHFSFSFVISVLIFFRLYSVFVSLLLFIHYPVTIKRLLYMDADFLIGVVAIHRLRVTRYIFCDSCYRLLPFVSIYDFFCTKEKSRFHGRQKNNEKTWRPCPTPRLNFAFNFFHRGIRIRHRGWRWNAVQRGSAARDVGSGAVPAADEWRWAQTV